MSHIGKVAGAVVGHRVGLEITPDAFDGVELGCVGGQVLEQDGPALSLDVSTYKLGAMRLQAIPGDQELLTDGGLQGF
jgi:hypothetical protein